MVLSTIYTMSSESISVREDPDLLQEEKQVSFVSSKADDLFRVHSDVASLTKRLLAHPEFEEESRRETDGDVVAVTGLLPVACLSVNAAPRENEGWAPIVSNAVLQPG